VLTSYMTNENYKCKKCQKVRLFNSFNIAIISLLVKYFEGECAKLYALCGCGKFGMSNMLEIREIWNPDSKYVA